MSVKADGIGRSSGCYIFEALESCLACHLIIWPCVVAIGRVGHDKTGIGLECIGMDGGYDANNRNASRSLRLFYVLHRTSRPCCTTKPRKHLCGPLYRYFDHGWARLPVRGELPYRI